MYRLICRTPANFLSAQTALVCTFFQMFIVLGMYNFVFVVNDAIRSSFFCSVQLIILLTSFILADYYFFPNCMVWMHWIKYFIAVQVSIFSTTWLFYSTLEYWINGQYEIITQGQRFSKNNKRTWWNNRTGQNKLRKVNKVGPTSHPKNSWNYVVSS